MTSIFGGQHRQAVADARGKGPGSPAGNFQADPLNYSGNAGFVGPQQPVTMGDMFSQMRQGNQGPDPFTGPPNPQDVAPPPGNMGPPQGQFEQKQNQGPDPLTGPPKTPYPQLFKAMLGGAAMTGPQNVYSPLKQRSYF